MITAEEKLAKMKEEKEAILKDIVNKIIHEIPSGVFLQPQGGGVAIQMILGLRACIEELQKHDPDYKFELNNIPGYVNGKPGYVG
jgi:hypothetical protein